jgi:hypothetical protein
MLNKKISIMTNIDIILKKILTNGRYSSNKDIPETDRQLLQRMKAFGLVSVENNTYRLTKDGYLAAESGDYEKWQMKQKEESKMQIENHTNSTVIKDSIITDSQIQINSQKSNQNKEKAID